jgi:hypothetical protein
MIKKHVKAARAWVFDLYLLIALAAVMIAGIYFVGTALHREGFPKVRWLWNEGLPAVAQSVHSDPWLLVAFLLTALFIWSFPWGDLTEGAKQSLNPWNHRRGRDVSGSKEANLRAYQELLRRRAAKQNNRQRSRHKS